jgi:ferrochelatase
VSRFAAEPPFAHDQTPRTGILLINLGTPDEPTAAAVKTYLREFLSDPRVIEIPRALWKLILHGVVLNVRPRRSAAKYASIWQAEGSPLRVHTERQTQLLRGLLGERGHGEVLVRYAMRYGQPSIRATLDALKAEHCERILVVPLYPQYAAATTATALDEVSAWCQRSRNLPEMRWVKHFHDHPAYIDALAASVRAHWQRDGRPQKLVMSFHGLPRYTLDRGDPYHCECHKTARLLAERLGLDAADWMLSFQSRFGRAEWLQPYTAATLVALAKQGVQHVDVICPGFVADCLETLEEIAIEGKADFLQAGGKVFHTVECLNERPEWIEALAQIVTEHGGDWLQAGRDAPAAQRTLLRAQAVGASR